MCYSIFEIRDVWMCHRSILHGGIYTCQNSGLIWAHEAAVCVSARTLVTYNFLGSVVVKKFRFSYGFEAYGLA
jgi:hypothetical protein